MHNLGDSSDFNRVMDAFNHQEAHERWRQAMNTLLGDLPIRPAHGFPLRQPSRDADYTAIEGVMANVCQYALSATLGNTLRKDVLAIIDFWVLETIHIIQSDPNPPAMMYVQLMSGFITYCNIIGRYPSYKDDRMTTSCLLLDWLAPKRPLALFKIKQCGGIRPQRVSQLISLYLCNAHTGLVFPSGETSLERLLEFMEAGLSAYFLLFITRSINAYFNGIVNLPAQNVQPALFIANMHTAARIFDHVHWGLFEAGTEDWKQLYPQYYTEIEYNLKQVTKGYAAIANKPSLHVPKVDVENWSRDLSAEFFTE